MLHIVEHLSERDLVDSNGDVRAAADFKDAAGDFLSEVPGVRVFDEPEALGLKGYVETPAERYDRIFDGIEQNLGSFVLARAEMDRRGLVDPVLETELDPDYATLAHVNAEAGRMAARDAAIEKVRQTIFDTQQQEKAIILINAQFRIKAQRRL